MSDKTVNPDVPYDNTKEKKDQNKIAISDGKKARSKSSRMAKPKTKRTIQKPIGKKTEPDFSLESLELLMVLKKEMEQTRHGSEKSAIAEAKKSINSFFKKYKVNEFGIEGEKYDLNKHYALLFMKKEDVSENIILEVKSPGLKAGRKVIKKSKVVVSK